MPLTLSIAPSAVYNAYNPICTINSCLKQVVGQIDGDLREQYSSCTSFFGSPTVSTVTPEADVVVSTSTSTASYTDVIVSLTTTTSTALETFISYLDAIDTTTVYTTTVTSTITATTAGPTWVLEKRSQGLGQVKRRRGACRHSSSSVYSAPSSASSSSVYSASSSASLSSSEPLSAPSSVISASSSASPLPISSHCPTVEEHLSACKCIGAVGTVSTVTEPASTSTSVVYEITTTTVPSVTESVITIVETIVIVQPRTTTITTTLSTAAATLVTVTTTTTPIAPTQTAYVILTGGPHAGKPLNVISSYVQWANAGPGAKIAMAMDSQSPWLPRQPIVTLWLHSANAVVGVMYFQTAAQGAGNGDIAVNCSVDPATGILSCVSSTGGHSKVLQCGAYVYLASPSFRQSSCTETQLKLSPWLA